MGATKWIGGILGWMVGGPLGALLGYGIGSLFDKPEVVDYTESERNTDEGNRNSFLFSLLAMSSYVIAADGRIMHSEMEYVRNFLRTTFGERAVTQGQDILLKLFEQKKQMDARSPGAYRNTIRQCAEQIAQHMNYEQRLQLLSFLAGISKADGKVQPEEVVALKEIARYMGLTEQEVDSMLSLGGSSLADAYKVLEISESATDAEVKKAYRQLALKHHPDTVASLGADVQRASEEKFKQITEAYERIKQARGMK